MKFVLSIIVVTLIFLQPAVGQSMRKSTAEIPDGWKVLKGENYWMIHPEEWELNTSGQMGTAYALLSPISSSEDKFRENLNFMIQDLSGSNMSLEKYTEISKEQVKTLLTGAKIIESTLISGNTRNYQKTIFTGKQGVFNLIFEQHYWVEDEKAFVLTFTCEENQYEVYKIIGDKMLNSFQLFVP